MSLFRNRALKWVPFGKGAVAEAERAEVEPVSTDVWDGPSLVMLVSDASGRASFQFHKFPDAVTAAEYVQIWYPSQMDGGVIAFWALTEEPARNGNGEPAAEAVVLIRDEDKTGVVYLFSFVDMEDARIFVQSETENGVNAECVMIHWAAPVRIDVDDRGSVRLSPEYPQSDFRYEERPAPQPKNEKPVEAPATNGWARVIGRNVQISPALDESTNGGIARVVATAPEAVQAETKAAAIVKAPRLEAMPPQIAPVEEVEAAPVEEPPVEATPVEATANEAAWATTVEESQSEATLVEATASEATPAPTVEEPQGEATLIETTESEATPVVATESERAVEPPAPATRERATEVAPVAPVTNGVKNGAKQAHSANGTNGSKPRQVVKVEVTLDLDAPRASMEDAKPKSWFEAKDGTPPRDGETWRSDGFHDIAFDMDTEVTKVLRVKRWKTQEEPFRGFESPPGRF